VGGALDRSFGGSPILTAPSLLGEAVLVDDLPVHLAQHGRNAKVLSELDLHSFRELLAG
jgi:hypothetical protein